MKMSKTMNISKWHRITRFLSGAALAFTVACGGSTPPPEDQRAAAKTPEGTKQPAGATGTPQAAPAAPVAAKPKVSGEAKVDFKAAVDAYNKAGRVTKENCEALAGAFGAVANDHPELVEAKFNEAVVWHDCGDLAKADAGYKAVLQTSPKYAPALNNLGEMAFAKGQPEQALGFFQKAAESQNSEGYANLALLQRNKASRGEVALVKDAVDNIHRALAVDSYNVEAYNMLATLLYDHAKSESQLNIARLICVQAIKSHPKFAPIRSTLALILLRQQKVTPALAAFRQAVALDPTLTDAHMNIGAITLSFRDYKTAETAFEKVLSLEADNKDLRIAALVGLGVARRGLKDYKGAMAKYAEAQKLDPQNTDIDFNIGILIQDYMFDSGNPSQGIADLQQAEAYLEKYAQAGKIKAKKKDAERRLKNLRQLVPMLQEQLKMMKEMEQNKAAEPAVKTDGQPPEKPSAKSGS